MTTFADIVPVKQLTSHTYSIDLDDAWNIGNVPNGGYVTSCFLLVARTHLSTTHKSRSAPHPISLHLEFLRRTSASPATFTVNDVKLGSRISNIHITLTQKRENGKTETAVEGYITMSNISRERGLTLDTKYTLHPPPQPVNLQSLTCNGSDLHWSRRRGQAFPKFRRANQHIRFHLWKTQPSNIPLSILDQWVRFSPHDVDGGRWTNDCLGFVVDMFPQIVEGYINAERGESELDEKVWDKDAPENKSKPPRPLYWYPTLSLNLEVKELLPVEGVEWLFVRMRAKVIKHGRLDLEVTVLDDKGGVVAISTHSSLIMDATRNMGPGGQKPARKETKL